MNMNNVLPWMVYFEMLNAYERKGYLEVIPDKNETFVTRAALFSLSLCNEKADMSVKTMEETICRIRAHRVYRSQLERIGKSDLKEDMGRRPLEIDRPFALYVVKEENPHDLICIILVTRRRKWYRFWQKTDCIRVVTYGDSHLQ